MDFSWFFWQFGFSQMLLNYLFKWENDICSSEIKFIAQKYRDYMVFIYQQALDCLFQLARRPWEESMYASTNFFNSFLFIPSTSQMFSLQVKLKQRMKPISKAHPMMVRSKKKKTLKRKKVSLFSIFPLTDFWDDFNMPSSF